MTRRVVALSLLLADGLALGGCGRSAQTQAGDTADAIAADVNATAATAVRQTTEALDAASTKIDRASDTTAAAADNAADASRDAAEHTAHETTRAADRAGDRVDNAM